MPRPRVRARARARRSAAAAPRQRCPQRRVARQPQQRRLELRVLVGHVDPQHGVGGSSAWCSRSDTIVGAALGEHAQQRGRRLARARVAQVRDHVGRLDVGRELGERDAAGDDASARATPRRASSASSAPAIGRRARPAAAAARPSALAARATARATLVDALLARQQPEAPRPRTSSRAKPSRARSARTAAGVDREPAHRHRRRQHLGVGQLGAHAPPP